MNEPTDLPFPVAQHQVWPSGADAPSPDFASRVSAAAPVDCPLEGLIATQPSLTVTRINPPGMPTTYPVVVEAGGRRYIYDGHKRLAAAKRAGATRATVRVVALAAQGRNEVGHYASGTSEGPAADVAMADWEEAKHPRGHGGKFETSTGGEKPAGKGRAPRAEKEETFLSSPGDAVASMLNGEKVAVSASDLREVLDKAVESGGHPDLTNLQVENTPIFAGGLGIKRADMPQIPSDQAQQYVDELKAAGITVKNESVSPLTLRPTQSEIDATKVGGMVAKFDKGKPLSAIFVSRDNYVLDGHHRWAAVAAEAFDDPGAHLKIPIRRIMADHTRALGTMHAYDRKHGIAHSAFGVSERHTDFVVALAESTEAMRGAIRAARLRLAGRPLRRLVRAFAAPTTPAAAAQHLEASASIAVQSASDRLVSSAQAEALRLRRAGWDPNEIEDALVMHLGELSDADLTRIANMEVNETFALGRSTAATANAQNIESATYSAILDQNTCPVCEELDGEEFDVNSDEYEENSPPNPNCEGGDACRCLPDDAPVWMGDFSFRPMAEVKSGDTVVGWRRRAIGERSLGQKRSSGQKFSTDILTRARVLRVTRLKPEPVVELALGSGETIVCTPDHKWLWCGRKRRAGVASSGGFAWRRAANIAVGDSVARVDVVDAGDCPEDLRGTAGWVGGLYDGEGSGCGISQSDKNGIVVAEAARALATLGFDVSLSGPRIDRRRRHASRTIAWRGGRSAAVKFARWVPSVRFRAQYADGLILTSRFKWADPVVGVRLLTPRPVMCLTTDTGNYVAYRACSHNCTWIYVLADDADTVDDPSADGA